MDDDKKKKKKKKQREEATARERKSRDVATVAMLCCCCLAMTTESRRRRATKLVLTHTQAFDPSDSLLTGFFLNGSTAPGNASPNGNTAQITEMARAARQFVLMGPVR